MSATNLLQYPLSTQNYINFQNTDSGDMKNINNEDYYEPKLNTNVSANKDDN